MKKLDGRTMEGMGVSARYAKHLKPLFIEFVKELKEAGYEIVEKTEPTGDE